MTLVSTTMHHAYYIFTEQVRLLSRVDTRLNKNRKLITDKIVLYANKNLRIY